MLCWLVKMAKMRTIVHIWPINTQHSEGCADWLKWLKWRTFCVYLTNQHVALRRLISRACKTIMPSTSASVHFRQPTIPRDSAGRYATSGLPGDMLLLGLRGEAAIHNPHRATVSHITYNNSHGPLVVEMERAIKRGFVLVVIYCFVFTAYRCLWSNDICLFKKMLNTGKIERCSLKIQNNKHTDTESRGPTVCKK